jgi:hypothetical protein
MQKSSIIGSPVRPLYDFGRIGPKYTFKGQQVPPGNKTDKKHVAISVSMKYGNIRYCCCFSSEPYANARIKHNTDFIEIDKKFMIPYFSETYKTTYIFFADADIPKISLSELQRCLIDNIYEEAPMCCEELFTKIIDGIKNSGNLSERCRKEILEECYWN